MTERPHVLLIEDSKSYAGLFSALVGELGFDCRVAQTLEEGKGLINGQEVCFCDLDLPDSDARETIEWLTEIRDKIPVVVLSGNEDPAIAELIGSTRMRFIHKGLGEDAPLKMSIIAAIADFKKRQERSEVASRALECINQLEQM